MFLHQPSRYQIEMMFLRGLRFHENPTTHVLRLVLTRESNVVKEKLKETYTWMWWVFVYEQVR